MTAPSKVTRFSLHVDRWKNCQACQLHEWRSRVVLYRGKIPCDVLFIGEAPGKSEDTLGVPFVGPAGILQDQMIARALGDLKICPVCGSAKLVNLSGDVCCPNHPSHDLVRDLPRLGFTNLVGCIPLDEDGKKISEPDYECVHACSSRLKEIIDIANPKLVVLVGVLSQTWLKKGYMNPVKLPDNVPTVEVDHPAYILRMPMAQQTFAIQRYEAKLRNAAEEVFG